MDSVSQEKNRITNIELEHLCFSTKPGGGGAFNKLLKTSEQFSSWKKSPSKQKIKSIN